LFDISTTSSEAYLNRETLLAVKYTASLVANICLTESGFSVTLIGFTAVLSVGDIPPFQTCPSKSSPDYVIQYKKSPPNDTSATKSTSFAYSFK
jgi:hypothetical protein